MTQNDLFGGELPMAPKPRAEIEDAIAKAAKIYAYPKPEGIAWGVNSAETGTNLWPGWRGKSHDSFWEFDEKAALLMQKQLKQYKRDRWWGRIRDRFVVNILVRLIILAVFGILSLMGVVR
jgi:hypothetical protein